jgi:hypothetical protein
MWGSRYGERPSNRSTSVNCIARIFNVIYHEPFHPLMISTSSGSIRNFACSGPHRGRLGSGGNGSCCVVLTSRA